LNFKLLLIVIAGAGALSYGFLGNDISLDIQEFDLVIMPPEDGTSLAGATQFDSVQCACRNGPTGTFGVCNTSENPPGLPDPNSLGPNGNKLCT